MSKKIVVIGSGPGGYPAALKAAALGAEVTVIEGAKVGGVCLNSGCIPSKSLLDAAHKFYELKKTAALSNDEDAAKKLFEARDFTKIQQRREAAVSKLQRGLLASFKAAKINYVEGFASFVSDKEIKVGEAVFPFDAAIIATGTKAFYPPPFNKHKDRLYDNSTIFNLNYIPKTITILGGGVIGCEFACIFNALGAEVTIVELLADIIPFEDEASISALKRSFEKRGIKIINGQAAKEIDFDGNAKIITLADGSKLKSDEVLVALGREADLSGLGLQNIGIEWDRKGIKANPQTLQVKDNIYAVGDVNGLFLLAHAATAQGEVAACHIMGHNAKYDNNLIPKAIYTWPEVASIGLTKKQALEQGKKVKVSKTFMLAIGRAVAQDETEGFVQVVSDEETGLILGAQAVGVCATETIHIPMLAIKTAMTLEQFKEIVFAHPSFSEAYKEVR